MLKICGIGLTAFAAVFLLRETKSGYAKAIVLLTSLLFFGFALTELSPLFSELDSALGESAFSEYRETILRAFGVTAAVEVTAGLCRDAGETAIASKIELAGKAELLLFCLPLIADLLAAAKELLS